MKQPNILFLMLDQAAPQVLKAWGGGVCRTPVIDSLAETGAVFENAYCNYPLCAPARYALMTGRLPSRIGAYDNACELPSEQPTFAHYLRALGYHTCLSGKMHFIGADQLHGFEERVTTEVYPSGFMWTADWSSDPEVRAPWYHSMDPVKEAGPVPRSVNTEYDFEVTVEAVRWLHDHHERSPERPFFLAVSYISPHDPYIPPPSAWRLYDGVEIDAPAVGDIPPEECDPHSRRLRGVIGRAPGDVTADEILNMRRAYYAVMSWIDRQIETVLDTLDDLGRRGDTVIVLTADHGDMLGERGLFYKMSFFEHSARVPLIVCAPGRFKPGRVRANVSLIDLAPTFLEWAGGGAAPDLYAPLDGRSLNGLLAGEDSGRDGAVHGEYTGEGAQRPLLMVRRGRYKYIYGEEDPPQLYDLESDPHELTNLAGRKETAPAEEALRREVMDTWDPALLRRRVLESQRRRLWLNQVLSTGKMTPWDWRPGRDPAAQYFRTADYGAQARPRGGVQGGADA